MGKEIIGYKLIKPEYYEAACMIGNTNLRHSYFNYNVAVAKCTINALRKGGVLDLWFEPVYEFPNYKIGDWVLTSKNAGGCGSFIDPVSDRILQITKIDLEDLPNYGGRYYFGKERTVGQEIVRLATQEEVNNTLIEEAKKRYPEGTVVKSALSGNKTIILSHDKIFVDSKSNINNDYCGFLYHNGKWAEIIETTPNITINGYKAEFFNNYVKFGCAEINKEMFFDLYACRGYPHNNRKIESITIGGGTFTKEQIKAIVEYYENK